MRSVGWQDPLPITQVTPSQWEELGGGGQLCEEAPNLCLACLVVSMVTKLPQGLETYILLAWSPMASGVGPTDG